MRVIRPILRRTPSEFSDELTKRLAKKSGKPPKNQKRAKNIRKKMRPGEPNS